MVLKRVYPGMYVRDDPSTPIIVNGVSVTPFTGRGYPRGPGAPDPYGRAERQDAVPPPPSTAGRGEARPLADRIRIRRIMDRMERRARSCKIVTGVVKPKFKPFYGRNISLGGRKPRLLYAAAVSVPGRLSFSRLVDGPPPLEEQDVLLPSMEGPIVAPPSSLVLAIRRKPVLPEDGTGQSKAKKRRFFPGQGEALGGRKEMVLRRLYGGEEPAGRFCFVWGRKFSGMQVHAIRPGNGAAVEIVPPITVAPAASVITRAGRIVRAAPSPYDPSDCTSPARVSREVESIFGRRSDGRFRVMVVMTEDELLDSQNGEGLLDRFYRLGVSDESS